jgi:PAS domain-containing protein
VTALVRRLAAWTRRDTVPRAARFRVFLVLSALLIASFAVLAGTVIGRFVERSVLAHEQLHTAEVVRGQAAQHLRADFPDSVAPPASADFTEFMRGMPGVFRVKVFDRSGRIVWSNEERLIGRVFPDNLYVRRAFAGEVITVLERPNRSEHVYERTRRYVAEAYVPIAGGDGGVHGVIETYRDATRLMEDLHGLQWTVWGVAGGLGLVLYVALAVVVWQASASEARAMARLQRQNHDLRLLQQFAQSVLRPLDRAAVAASVVASTGQGLGLTSAELYRVVGDGFARLAAWPPSAARPEALSLARVALERGEPVHEDLRLALPLSPAEGPAHVFVGGLPEIGCDEALLQTLAIMLHEATVALSNVELVDEIRQAHQRLAAILAGIADSIVIVDAEMRVVWRNEAAAALGGEGEPGQRCYAAMGGDAGICQACPAVRTFVSGTVERAVRTQRLSDGRLHHLDVISAPLRDAAGRVTQVLEVARDVTDLVEMEERLKQANQALMDAQARLVDKERLAVVGELVVGLHHAILNPLAGILGALRLLRQGTVGPEDHERALAEAEDEARKIEQLVRRLHHLRRVDPSPYIGDTTMLDLERLVRERPD